MKSEQFVYFIFINSHGNELKMLKKRPSAKCVINVFMCIGALRKIILINFFFFSFFFVFSYLSKTTEVNNAEKVKYTLLCASDEKVRGRLRCIVTRT